MLILRWSLLSFMLSDLCPLICWLLEFFEVYEDEEVEDEEVGEGRKGEGDENM